jgi:flavin reductase (DIM6/NTAB) family NADH-FMN oxidoreductase RutF
MQQRDFFQDMDQLMARIKKGALLTVKEGDSLNTMTIGWATVGIVWQRPVFMVAVRDSRHTFGILERSDNFTVSIPAGEDLRKAVMFCGTKSGRDLDKFKECGLHTQPAQRVATPIIRLAGTHYECRIVFKSAMNPAYMDPALATLYPAEDYHTLYFGEILACYDTK